MSTFPRPNRDVSQMVWVRAPISGAKWQVHREVAPLLAHIVSTAERRGYLFDHGPGDVDDDWGYNVRRIAGSSNWSWHSAGVAVDIDARTLDWAKDFGATHTCNSSTTDPVEYIRSVTGGNGADVCIEAIGNPAVYKQAFEARDLAGTVVLVGVPNPAHTLELPFIEVFGRGGSLKSSWYGDCLPSRDFPMLIDLYLQGRLDLDRFVSETISLDDVEEAFHKMERGEVLRSVVVM